MTNSLLYINESASTTLGLTLSHPVNALIGHRGNHIVTHTSPVYTTAKVNRRQLIADKGSSDNGQSRDMSVAYKRVSQCCQPGESPGTLVRAALPERQNLSRQWVVRAWSSQNSVKFVSGRVHSRQRSDNGLGRTSITKGHQGVIHRLLTILEGYVCQKETSNCLRFDFPAKPERQNSVMMVNRGHG